MRRQNRQKKFADENFFSRIFQQGRFWKLVLDTDPISVCKGRKTDRHCRVVHTLCYTLARNP